MSQMSVPSNVILAYFGTNKLQQRVWGGGALDYSRVNQKAPGCAPGLHFAFGYLMPSGNKCVVITDNVRVKSAGNCVLGKLYCPATVGELSVLDITKILRELLLPTEMKRHLFGCEFPSAHLENHSFSPVKNN